MAVGDHPLGPEPLRGTSDHLRSEDLVAVYDVELARVLREEPPDCREPGGARGEGDAPHARAESLCLGYPLLRRVDVEVVEVDLVGIDGTVIVHDDAGHSRAKRHGGHDVKNPDGMVFRHALTLLLRSTLL